MVCAYTSLCVLMVFRLMMFRNVEELHREANWSGVSGGARQKLMEQLQSEPLRQTSHSLVHTFICNSAI